ncbi:MAG: hypothetical protein HQL95_02230 [Magnetococcales bacterium]|nr:hypothetical protein [Magnetococcales bacterium]
MSEAVTDQKFVLLRISCQLLGELTRVAQEAEMSLQETMLGVVESGIKAWRNRPVDCAQCEYRDYTPSHCLPVNAGGSCTRGEEK